MSRKWSKNEIEILKSNYKNSDKDILLEKLIGRTWSAIENKARELNCRRGEKNCDERDGYRKCKKCGKELPLTFKYFPKLKSEKDYRHVCRECSSKYKNYLPDNYTPKHKWNKSDEELFKSIYPNYTNEEIIKLYFPYLTKKQIIEKAYKKRLKKKKSTYLRSRKQQALKLKVMFKGRIVSEETKKKISENKKKQYAEGKLISPWKGRVVSEEEKMKLRKRVEGRGKGNNNPRHKKPLKREQNGRWQGGITGLSQCLRENISEWKKDSMKMCNYKCILTGDWFNEIHHVIPFNEIVINSMSKLGLSRNQDISDYTIEEREKIIEEIKIRHKQYGLGYCLTKDLHKLFHDNYGYLHFEKESFYEFAQRYFNGEFDKYLIDKHKSINSKTNYNEVLKIIKNNFEKIR